MTEFIVVASFILVPLFLIIPLLARYTDIQHSTIQAARYEAWEYTAWFNNSNDIANNFNVVSVIEPVKTITDVRNESRQRFFSDTNTILSDMDKTGWSNGSKNNAWHDHKNNDLYNGAVEGSYSYNSNTPDATGGVISSLSNLVAAVPNFITRIPGIGRFTPDFTILNNEGLNTFSVTTSVRNAPHYTDIKSSKPLFETDLDLKFTAQAAVLSDGWNAGGREHAKTEAEGLVPTRLLREPFDFVVDILNFIPFIPAGELQSLEWGHTDSEAIPPEYMSDYDENTNATECNGDGYCGY